MMANELLMATREFIGENPGRWDQTNWRSCFAGHAVRIAKEAGVEMPEVDIDAMTECICVSCRSVDMEDEKIVKRATILLGLSAPDASMLFRGSNNLGHIDAAIARILKEAELVSA